MATLTIRVIKSFEYRTTKNIILHDVSLSTTVKDLKDLLQKRISTDAGFKPYRTTKFDTLKTYFKSHGSKSQNLIINIDQSGFLEDEKTLEELGIENETEISYFVGEDYLKYAQNPEIKW